MAKDDTWEFDWRKWTLEDIVAFEGAKTLAERLPLMGKVLIKTPYGVDLANPAEYKNVSVDAWKEIQKRFVDAVTGIFQ